MAECSTGVPCLREVESGHPCDRDEDGDRAAACERHSDRVVFTGRNTREVRGFLDAPDGASWFITRGMTASTGNQAWRYARDGDDWPDAVRAAVYDLATDTWLPVADGDTIVRNGVGVRVEGAP